MPSLTQTMKKVFLLAFAVFVLGCISHATTIVPEKVEANTPEIIVNDNVTLSPQDLQATSDIRKGMSYKELKKIYNPKEYIRDVTDPYNSGVAGVCSFFIPGLGQIIDGEVGRGLLMVLGAGVLGGVCYATAVDASSVNGMASSPAICLVSGAAALALDIWSIFDAVKVAKVKNMYNQDLRKLFTDNNVNITLSPSLAYVPMSGGLTPAAGVALRVSF